jgi:TolB protein
VADLGYELAWSPDSRHLAFTQVANSRRFLSVLALDSGVITQLGEGQQAQWSPDGQKIAFQRVLGCDCLPEIRIASLLARTDRKLTGGADPVWSPDGRWVGFFRGTRSPPSLWAIPVTGGTARRLARRVSGSYWIMKWTRDSRSIAFVKDAGHCRTTLNLVRVRGGGARRLAVEHGLVSPLAWTSARRLLYADRVCSG